MENRNVRILPSSRVWIERGKADGSLINRWQLLLEIIRASHFSAVGYSYEDFPANDRSGSVPDIQHLDPLTPICICTNTKIKVLWRDTYWYPEWSTLQIASQWPKRITAALCSICRREWIYQWDHEELLLFINNNTICNHILILNVMLVEKT